MTSQQWYVLYAKDPLEAKNRLERMMETYAASGKEAFPLRLRTPNEFIDTKEKDEGGSKTFHDYLFHYIFAYADLQHLEPFLRFCGQISPDVWLLNHRNVDNEPERACVGEDEITRFFSFCEAFRMYNRNTQIHFIELTPETAEAGDLAEIISGQYAGQRVRIDEEQYKVSADDIQVCFTWFKCMGIHMSVSKDSIRMIRKAKYSNSKYAIFDEFFDFLQEPATWERYTTSSPSTSDIAKALRMKSNARFSIEKPRHGQRQSLRLRLMNLAALIASYHILDDNDSLREHHAYWRELICKNEENNDMETLTRIVEVTMPHTKA